MTTESPAKRDIRKLSQEELKDFFIAQGDKAFRAQQVWEWLWKKSVKDFDQMTNLSVATRELLKTHNLFDICNVERRSKDLKSLFINGSRLQISNRIIK
ncbi:MAG: hypothetical protein K2U26_18995 [Cyclobacteriaceae bacterium]|nr:hypothetical protein [Cyclobacteriaceae bacterium]